MTKFDCICDLCANLQYDEEYGYYCECAYYMDEDDCARFRGAVTEKFCPMFVSGDEYKVVRHQM